MIDFHDLQLSDKKWMDVRFRQSDFIGCDYDFAWLYPSKDTYHVQVAEVADFLCIRAQIGNHLEYWFPTGNGDKKEIIALLQADAHEHQQPLVLHTVLNEEVSWLQQEYPDLFSYEAVRDVFDYIYTTEHLINLSGKKLRGKRNLMNQFKEANDWYYEKLTDENIFECLELSKKWSALRENGANSNLKEDIECAETIVKNYKELGLQGGLLRKAGNVVAFAIGGPLNSNTFVEYVEKADIEVTGAYTMIYQQFVQNECSQYQYLNAACDLGEDGIRNSKLLYYPDILLEKYTVTENYSFKKPGLKSSLKKILKKII